MIGAGAKHYFIYMMAAEIQFEQKQYRACVPMCNLAVYEKSRRENRPLYHDGSMFSSFGETEQMFECFNRIEN